MTVAIIAKQDLCLNLGSAVSGPHRAKRSRGCPAKSVLATLLGKAGWKGYDGYRVMQVKGGRAHGD